ncbi:unnamed protein product, partial [marine sediment metagenome]
EGKKRAKVAQEGIAELNKQVDSLITIPNEKLLTVLGKTTSLLDAFKAANNVLLGAVQGIADLITRPGLINVDFADVRTVMREMGTAMMGTGVASGEERAREAAESAIRSPLLDEVNLNGARGVLVNITAGMDMAIGEFEEVGEVVKSFTSDDATVVVGTVVDPDMSGEMRVTIVATGLASEEKGGQGQMRLVESNTNKNTDGTIDYQRLERPTVIRRQAGSTKAAEGDIDYLDIPAFLRRQAD